MPKYSPLFHDLQHKPHLLLGLISLGIGTVLLVSASIMFLRVQKLEKNFDDTASQREIFSTNFSEVLFNDHLSIMEKNKLEFELARLNSELSKLKGTSDETTADEIYVLYAQFNDKLKRNLALKLIPAELEAVTSQWGDMLINKQFLDLKKSMNDQISILDANHKKYIDSLPKVASGGSGGSFVSFDTERGKIGMYLIKVGSGGVRVKTVSASDGDCSDDCPTKSLADYVKDAGVFAGMNGTYFCPPDYPSCDGKKNSFDYALYNSDSDSWINEGARGWSATGLMTFSGGGGSFYSASSDFGGGSVDAGISNYPSLVKNGEIVIDEGALDSYQKDVKGSRGVIGIGGGNIFLAIVTNATVVDAAYAIQAAGAEDALNLDGGGSSALYNGGYLVGPGRSLPNAVVLTR